jgi:ABC-type lipoprotein release transport system permease subunit
VTAVALRLRAELRTRWRAWTALAVLLGVAAGLVVGAAAGARRTDSAYGRFLVAQNAFDVIVGNYPDPGAAVFDPAAIERLPQVAESAQALFTFIENTAAFAGRDNRLGTELNRFKLVRGRTFDPRRADEVVLSLTAAEHLGYDVGDTFPLIAPEDADEAAALGVRNLRLRVVGVEVSPGELPPQLGTNPGFIHLSPAFYAKYRDVEGDAGHAVVVRLRHGQADVRAFRAALERMSGGKPFGLLIQDEQGANVRRSIHFQAVGLWLFTLLLGVAVACVLGQTLARQTVLESGDNPTLRALGMTRRQLWSLAAARAFAVGAVGALLAVAVALVVSPLTPIGLARTAEPDPGLAVDWRALLIGAAATVVATVLVAAVPALRAAGAAARGPGRQLFAGRIATLDRLPAPAAAGIRLALEPGSGRAAVPVRSTLAAVVVAVAALGAALTFAASLSHLLRTPRLYGETWDAFVTDYGYGGIAADGRAVAAADPGIEAFSIGTGGMPLLVNGRRLDGGGYDAVEGQVLPPLLAGRYPAGPAEIALGARSLRDVRAGIGDGVTVRVVGGRRTARLRVVGEVVLPGFTETARLGQGALLTFTGVRRLAPGVPASDLLLDLAPGADRERVLARLGRKLRRGEARPVPPPLSAPADLVNFGRVQRLPVALAAVLALLGALTLAHMLLTGTRRRARELAVLKAVGFVRSQVVAAVVWQATTVAAVSLLVGLPLGVALGRWAWRLFAHELGIVPDPVVPLGRTLLVVPAALLAANFVAALPARVAARTKPAPVLRTE